MILLDRKKGEAGVMKIGVIQAGSQIDKNKILYETVLKNAKKHEVVNFHRLIIGIR